MMDQLLLSCKGLSPSALCRFIPALPTSPFILKKITDPDLQDHELQFKRQLKDFSKEIESLMAEKSTINEHLNRLPSKESIDALEKTLSEGKMRYQMDEALDRLPIEDKRKVLSWFFPKNQTDELGRRYGVYVIMDENSDFELELHGLFNAENAKRLIEELRDKKTKPKESRDSKCIINPIF